MKTTDFYLIKAISNLHVGSGEGDFSHIDKQVQRDTVTHLPTIHASGIKGALREGMEEKFTSPKNGPTNDTILTVFGSHPKLDRGNVQKQGLYNFFDGHLLSLPIRSSHHFFYRATCPQLLEALADALAIYQPGSSSIAALRGLAGIAVSKGSPVYFGTGAGNIQLEDWTATHNAHNINGLAALLPDRIALLHNDDFCTLAQQLPVIARNYLENGQSENLWYEEVVPRESIFYTMVTHIADTALQAWLRDDKQNIVQLGANATVGYGLCSFTKN
jgi:CRISPR-associated protein Cmr4